MQLRYIIILLFLIIFSSLTFSSVQTNPKMNCSFVINNITNNIITNANMTFINQSIDNRISGKVNNTGNWNNQNYNASFDWIFAKLPYSYIQNPPAEQDPIWINDKTSILNNISDLNYNNNKTFEIIEYGYKNIYQNGFESNDINNWDSNWNDSNTKYSGNYGGNITRISSQSILNLNNFTNNNVTLSFNVKISSYGGGESRLYISDYLDNTVLELHFESNVGCVVSGQGGYNHNITCDEWYNISILLNLDNDYSYLYYDNILDNNKINLNDYNVSKIIITSNGAPPPQSEVYFDNFFIKYYQVISKISISSNKINITDGNLYINSILIDMDSKLNVTDQRYNETSLILNINSSLFGNISKIEQNITSLWNNISGTSSVSYQSQASGWVNDTQNITTFKNVGIGVVPSARLELSAGNSTIAPLKFNKGMNLNVSVVGSIEFDGDNFYATVLSEDNYNTSQGNFLGLTSFSTTEKEGMKFLTNEKSRLVNVKKLSSCSATMVYLTDSSLNVLASSLFIGNNAYFNYILPSNKIYYILLDAEGSEYTSLFNEESYPINDLFLTWLNGYDGSIEGGNDYTYSDGISGIEITAWNTTVRKTIVLS